VSVADLCLASQVVGAELFGCELVRIPRVMDIFKELMTLPAFSASMPKRQSDAPQQN
jgi:glutathione S-transferase